MAPSTTLTLAHKGITKTAIVLPQGATEILRQAAADLQATLEKIIGMAPPIKADDGQPALRGNSALHVGATTRAGVEGYRLVTCGNDLFIVGGSECGTAYGVYGLLEDHLGVRFFMPGELFADIPVHTTLRLAPIDEIKTTPFSQPPVQRHLRPGGHAMGTPQPGQPPPSPNSNPACKRFTARLF